MMMNANAYAMKRCGDNLCYGEVSFIRNNVLLIDPKLNAIYI